MKKRDKRRPAEGEPGRTGEMEGGDGKRVGTRFGLLDTVGKDLNDRSCLSSSACTFRSVWRLVSSSFDGEGDGDDDDNRDESRLCMKSHLFIKSPTTSSSRCGSTCRLFPDSIIRLLHTDIHRTPENSEQIGNTDSSKLLSLDHEQKPPRSFYKLTVDRRKCARAPSTVLANRLQGRQTGIRYWVRHLDIISDDRNAATGDEERRATGASASAPAAAAAAAAATEEEEEEEVEEEEEKTRNTLACSKRKEQIKFKGEEREEGERMEQKEQNSLLAGSKRKGRDEDGEKTRCRERWRVRACAKRP
ncbi:hypothetical protein ALC53_08170 [Atta colombica]|uniref:Uncharacterized protein n=1 Tax=Atta colombica TaxID=520822 RepID=A0A195BAZ2_9HYME|nr:hypothetical protein ALC53_08170 [Atta colombica]